MEFLNCEARETLYSGAVGAGKSYAIALLTAIRASSVGAREALCRKHLVTLKATTLRTLLDGDGDMPPVLPRGMYTHNKSEKIIRIRGGGEIVYFGLDEPEKIGSYNLSGVNVDEAVELTEHDWIQLLGRIRLKVRGLPNRISGACNPGPPSHFLAERFGLALGFQGRESCHAIRTRTDDNFFLPDDYVQSVSEYRGTYRKRYFEGLWVGSEGLIYDNWLRETHVQVREGPWKRSFVTVDDGSANPFVALLVHEDGDGRLHIEREFYYAAKRDRKPSLLVSQKVQAVRDLCPDPSWVEVDPSAKQLITELVEAGFDVPEPMGTDRREVTKGIQCVHQRLSEWGDTGEPGLTVDPSCVEVVREFETYEWATNAQGAAKDEPVKTNDHGADCTRYLVVRIDGVQEPYASSGEPDRPKADPNETLLNRFQRMREDADFGFDD